jgi:hypothetical protein
MKSLIAGGIVIAAFALAGNAAMAADTHAKTSARRAHVAHAHAVVHAAVRKRNPRARSNVDYARYIQYMLGGGWPSFYANVVHVAGKPAASRGHAASPAYVPSYDTSPAIDASSAAREAQAAADAENAAIQSMNDTNAMTASMAAAQQQNDAANAATLQTELNAGF